MFLQPSPSQLDKCLHFYSTLMVRHGVMLLGPTGGGKSTVLKLLKMALNKAHGDFYGEKAWRVLGDISLSESLSLAGSIREVRIENLTPFKKIVTQHHSHAPYNFLLLYRDG